MAQSTHELQYRSFSLCYIQRLDVSLMILARSIS